MISTRKYSVILNSAIALCAIFGWAVISQAQDHVPWRYDLEQATKIAADEDKLILLHFTANWCGPCKELDRFVFVNPMAIHAMSSQVVPVKVDVDLHRGIAEKYDVKSVPFDVVITPAGHIIGRRKSPRSADGYKTLIDNSIQFVANKTTEELDARQRNRAQMIAMAEKEKASLKNKNETENTNDFEGQRAASLAKTTSPWTSATGVNQPETPSISAPSMESPTHLMPTASGPPPLEGFRPADVASSFVPADRVAAAKAAQDAYPLGNSGNASDNSLNPTSNSMGGTFAPRRQLAQQITNDVKTNGDSAFVKNAFSGQEPRSVTRNPFFVADQSSPGNSNSFAQSGNAASTNVAQKGRTDGPIDTLMQAKKAPENQAKAKPTTFVPPKIGLEEYCCVSLVENQKWVRGDRKWGCIHRGRLYFFESQAKRDRFRMTPDVYSPLLGGNDPVEFHVKGSLADGKRSLGVFYGEDDGPSVIVLFNNEKNRELFEKDPTPFIGTVRRAMSRLDSDKILR